MAASYREKLDKIRLAFPQPVSDRVHDSYFVHSVMRALDLVDSLKSEVPVLGPREPLDYAAAQQASVVPRVALKSFILSPFTDEANVEAVVDKVLEARTRIAL